MNNLAMYLVSNFCNPFSANFLAEELGFSSVATTKKFMACNKSMKKSVTICIFRKIFVT